MELFNSIEFFDGIQQFIALVVAVIVHRKDFVLILFKTRKALACCRLYSYDTSLFNILVNTVCVALISAVVEVLQYIFAVGSADIDDVILNTVGGLIGVSLFRVMELLLKDQTK